MNYPSEHPLVSSSASWLPVEQIIPRPSLHYAPDESSLEALIDDIRENGLLRPILVRRCDDRYQVVSGNRRLMACRHLGMMHIETSILPPWPAANIPSLLAAVASRNYHYLDEAHLLAQLNAVHGLRLEAIAQALTIPAPLVVSRVRLMELDEPLRAFLMDEGAPERVAQALLRLPDAPRRMAVARRAAREHLCIRDVEALITAALTREGSLPEDFLRKEASCMEQPTPSGRHRRAGRAERHPRVLTFIRDVRPYVNAIREITGQMQNAGFPATFRETASAGRVELTICLSTRRRRAARYQSSSM